jgi:choline dehydrogenase
LAKVGRKGPLDVACSDMVPELETFRQALSDAWVSKGGVLNDNIYEGQQHGLVKCMSTIYKGVRSTSAVFLDNKPNITIVPRVQARKLIIADGVAKGVIVVTDDGEDQEYFASKEVILSCGVFESPKVLMLSGIGEQSQLAKNAIDQILESKHVGQNLIDHPILSHVFKLKDGCGLDAHLLRNGPAKEAALASYRKNHTEPLHSGLLELVAFPRVDDRLMKNKEYVKAKEANGNVDPFGPDSQPHFEIDFVPMFCDAFQRRLLDGHRRSPAPSLEEKRD